MLNNSKITLKLKYLKLKYFLMTLKNLCYKVKFRNKILFASLMVGFEKHCLIMIKDNGKIQLGYKNYFTRFTNIEVYGGLIEFGNNVFFNKNCNIVCRQKIKIGNNCLFGPNVSIYDHDHGTLLSQGTFFEQEFYSEEIKIGNNVWIGTGAVILKGVTIEDNVVVGANAVVTKNLEKNSFYGGIPAKKIKALI